MKPSLSVIRLPIPNSEIAGSAYRAAMPGQRGSPHARQTGHKGC